MTDRPSHRIAEQSYAYRRGLVLGLTMAEVGILIIFVLLLLIAFWQWRDRRIASADLVQISRDRATELESAAASIVRIRNELNAKDEEEVVRAVHKLQQDSSLAEEMKEALGVESAEEIARLVRALRQQNPNEAASDLRAAAQEVDKALKAAKDAGTPDALAKELERQSFRIANQEGQLKRYEAQLAIAGLGKGERPCWVKPDGTIEYLYDVVLATDGIRMREYEHANRTKERADLPAPAVDPSETLTQSEFIRRTQPLYESSLAQNCRFFVVVYDGTGSTEKEKYKDLLRTVEGHFYKRLDSGPAPF